MSLLTDSDHVTQSDMAAVDPEIPDIVAAESFTSDQVTALIQQAWDTSANAIVEVTRPYYESYPDPVLAFHQRGLFSPLQLSRVVVTSEYATRLSPLKNWMVCVAIETFYMALANRRDSDRYSVKLGRAQGYTKSAWRTVVAAGLSTVVSPLVCPGATHELGAGVFSTANVTAFAGGTDLAANYEVAISWTSAGYQSPSIPANCESGPSESVAITIPQNSRLRVNIVGLNPPGSLTIPRPITQYYVSQTATGWNIYVGIPGAPKYLQNSTPLPIATTSYDFSAAPILSGNQLWSGQVADSRQTIQRIAGRA